MRQIENQKTIMGIDFKAIRKTRPIPHWRAMVVKTGYVFEAGVFKSESRPKMWESIEYTAKRLGLERFTTEILSE